MRRLTLLVPIVFVTLVPGLHAAVFSFTTDPFEGSTALTTPGRQVVGGEPFITFDPAADVYAFSASVFGVTALSFVNDLGANLPSGGVNVIVLQNTDNPFNAGLAANLIADQIDTPGPGFFIYFNSGLDLPRLVFSTDLSDATADLKILARMTNLAGNSGALPSFTSANFVLTPEPSSAQSMALGGLLLASALAVRRKGKRR